MLTQFAACLAVVPVLTGPLQLLLTILPALVLALLGLLASLFKPQAMKTALALAWRLKLPLALIVAGTTGVVWALPALLHRPNPASRVAETTDDEWPLFRGGLERTGVAAGSASPTRGGVQWSWQEGAAAVFSSPAIVGNRVYFTTATMALLGGGSGEIVCLDADTGAVAWRAAPPGYRATFSSPVVAGQSLVCGEGLHFIRDARVICLDLRAGHEGEIRWTHRTNSHVECTPVAFKNRVYIGAGEDGYYCIELEPDAAGQAQGVWHVPGQQYPDAETSLAVWEDDAGRRFVYAGLGLGGKALCVLDADTGRELRRVELDYPVFGPPAIADGRLLVGMGNGDFVHPARELGAEPAGGVLCFDLPKLNDPQADPLLWKFATQETVLGAVAVYGDTAYFGSRDGWLYAVLTSDGTRVAAWNARSPIVTSPAVTETHVYTMIDSGVLLALERLTLRPHWETKIGSQPLFISSPSVGRGHVYVGSQHDGLLCIGDAGVVATPLWPGHLGGAGQAGNPLNSPLPDVGTFGWQFPSDQTGETKDALLAAPPAALGDNLYVPLAGATQRGIVCLPTDVVTDEAPPPRWTYRTENPVVVSPASVHESLFVVDGRSGDAGRSLHCLLNGQLRWKTSVNTAASGVFVATADERDVLYVVDEPVQLSARRQFDGQLIWRESLGRMLHAPTAARSLLAAAVFDPPQLVLLDRPMGRVLWRVPLAGEPTTPPVVEQSVIYLGTSAGLEARSLVDGRPLAGWTCDAGSVASDLLLAKDSIAYVSADNRLFIVHRETGTTRRTIDGARAGIAPRWPAAC